jgi:DNA transformation protein
MFGGWGLFLDDTMFGLIAGERLYFKVDDDTEPRFAAAGAKPFTYQRHGKQVAMSYREVPSGGAEARLAWAELGLEAARRARMKRPKKARNR